MINIRSTLRFIRKTMDVLISCDSPFPEGFKPVVDSLGTLRFVTLCQFSNAGLRSQDSEMPAVCGLLIEYANWLELNRQSVLTKYGQQAEDSVGLHALDTTPRLIIVGFNHESAAAVAELRAGIVAAVKEKLPSFGLQHVQVVGDPKNVQPRHFGCC
jgi:hypothetical protein